MPRKKSDTITRREMLQRTAAGVASVGVWSSATARASSANPLAGTSPNEKLNIAVIGIGGRGRANLNAVSGENIVALCDVDDKRAGDAYQKHPKARKFYDYRRMLDSMQKDIDAVVISTPDHTHFHPAMASMQLGKHCYCEKPMAHSVWECRQMTDLAREKKLVTQLGVQRHTIGNVHRVVEIVQSGAIGDVSECYAWVGGKRGMPAVPKSFPEVPSNLKWDLWLGPAKKRPYSDAYAPYNWRFWWDFGTGETGNWGCHVLDIPYWALNLKYPISAAANGPERDEQRTPKSMDTTFQFPARGSLPPVKLHWSHTATGPAILKEHNMPHFGTGVLFIGKKGMLLCEFGKRRLYPEKDFADFEPPPKTIPDSPGFHREWINACKGDKVAPTCNFDYSGPMAETVLLGNAAYRAGASFDWDAESLTAKGKPEIQRWTHSEFRDGWSV